jgi:hypothetical protein
MKLVFQAWRLAFNFGVSKLANLVFSSLDLAFPSLESQHSP